jgi:hypothetical protein
MTCADESPRSSAKEQRVVLDQVRVRAGLGGYEIAMGRSAARRAENEATFRGANESIEESAQSMALTALPIPFICECEDERCIQIVRLTIAEYEDVRRHGRHFLVSPGHHSEPDRVVAEADTHTTVEKTGEEGRLVAAQDPRA